MECGGIGDDGSGFEGIFGCLCSDSCAEGSLGRCRVSALPEVEAMTLLSACWPIDGVLDPELVRRQFAISAHRRRVVEVAVLEVPWGTGREPTAAQVVDALAAHLVPGERG